MTCCIAALYRFCIIKQFIDKILVYIENYSILYIDKRAPIIGCSFFTVGGTNFVRETPKRILGIVKGRIT